MPVNITSQVSTYKNKHFLLNERECFNLGNIGLNFFIGATDIDARVMFVW